MPKKKKTTARRSKSTRASYSGGIDDHSFLIIAGGGLVILMIVGFMLFGNSSGNTTAAPTDVTVQKSTNAIVIKDFAFAPESTTVKVGTTVTWDNQDSVEHSAVADDGTFETKVLASGEKGSFTFSKAGSYTYHCGIHPSMTGTIVVE